MLIWYKTSWKRKRWCPKVHATSCATKAFCHDEVVTLPCGQLQLMGVVIEKIGPWAGLNVCFSIDHFTRNLLRKRHQQRKVRLPMCCEFAKRLSVSIDCHTLKCFATKWGERRISPLVSPRSVSDQLYWSRTGNRQMEVSQLQHYLRYQYDLQIRHGREQKISLSLKVTDSTEFWTNIQNQQNTFPVILN